MVTPSSFDPMPPGTARRPQVRFDAIGEAWELFTDQMGAWIGAQLLLIGICLAVFLFVSVVILGIVALSGMEPEGRKAASGMVPLLLGISAVAALPLLCWLTAGLYRMAVRQVRGERIGALDLFHAGDVWLPALGASLVIGIVVCIGYHFFFLPGMILGGLLMLTLPLIVDRRLGVMDALQQSWNALKTEWLMAGLFYFVLGLVSSLGAIVIIGALFTYPLVFLGQAIVYRDFFLVQPVPSPMTPTAAMFDMPPLERRSPPPAPPLV